MPLLINTFLWVLMGIIIVKLHRIPALESVPDVRPQREELPGPSPGEKVGYYYCSFIFLVFNLI